MRLLAFALVAAAAGCGASTKPPAPPSNTVEPEGPPVDVPPPTAALQDGKVALSAPIVFVTGTDDLAQESEGVLAALAGLLRDRTDITMLRIEGHSDSQGMDDYNQRMSEDRALAVARWLVGNGIECGRLVPVGFGETKPIGDNQTPEGRALNRRIELIPAALRGRPIGGMPVDGGGQVAGDPCAP